MARYPDAEWRPIPENYYQAPITPTQLIFHSAVDAPGPSTLYNWFARADVGVETHCFITLEGEVEQYVDTNVRADGNLKANVRAISVETEDDGNPDQREWTDEQVKAIKALTLWVHKTHDVPLRMCPEWDQPGIGYHTMWGAPSPWTPSVKTCPGVIRKRQWWAAIEPWIRAVAAATPPPVAPPPPGVCEVKVRVLGRGDKGGDVRSLQALLNAKAGKALTVDGDFGPKTDRAVRTVQRFFGLTADGIVGAKTWPCLFL